MAELVDAHDSKSCEGDLLGVRFSLPAPQKPHICGAFCFLLVAFSNSRHTIIVVHAREDYAFPTCSVSVQTIPFHPSPTPPQPHTIFKLCNGGDRDFRCGDNCYRFVPIPSLEMVRDLPQVADYLFFWLELVLSRVKKSAKNYCRCWSNSIG